MKTLNDSLREEFREILNEKEFSEIIKEKDLDPSVLYKAFDVLLRYKSDSDLTDKARGEFENFIINYMRIKAN
ncbi:hypothetical protein [Mangrovimonas xylaniphaga]|uniref:hypothetical protein n=1 Tax=Mangrovimonas xylaniphaga TaxID=1645915 RepID=UPI0006B61FF5|nr:hypothetical protein [Mangrovimonas xylaniphaga]